MRRTLQVVFAMIALMAAQMACNLPTQENKPTGLPSANQTLTALFAITPGGTSTPTLPPVVTSTTAPGAPTATSTQSPAANPTATFTQRPNPTATSVPPSATIPGMRPRAAIRAVFLSTPPVLDGDWSEWKDITDEYPAATLVYGGSNWTNADDLAGSFHIGWDNNYLYVAVKVRDDVYVQNATGENIFKGDSIEILFDRQLQADFYVSSLSPDDFQLGLSPGRPDPSGTREAYLWLPSNIAGNRSGVTIAARQETGIYRVEAAIPWNVLETTPVAGAHYGFALSVSDNDDASANVQQSMVSNVSTRRLTDPTTWGDLLLVR